MAAAAAGTGTAQAQPADSREGNLGKTKARWAGTLPAHYPSLHTRISRHEHDNPPYQLARGSKEN